MLKMIPAWLGKLSVGQKLTLIYLLDLTAVIYVSSVLIQEKYLAIDFARKEIVGASYTDAVRSNLHQVFIDGTPAKAVSDVTYALHNVRQQSDADLRTGELAERFTQLVATGHKQSEGDKAQTLRLGRELLTTVGNQSNLILDPDLDSYYVMSLSVLRFPELLQVLHEIQQFMQSRGQLQSSPPSGNPLPSLQMQAAQLLTLLGRLDAVLQALESDYQQVWLAGSPPLQAALQESREQLLQRSRLFELAVKEATELAPATTHPAALNAAYQSALSALDQAWSTSIGELKALLLQRVDSLFARMWLHLGTALVLLCGILSMVYLVASQIAKPLQSLARVADRVRHATDYSLRASWHSTDEIGQLFDAFNRMLAQLDQDRLTQQDLIANARVADAQRELMEAMPIPMLVTSVPHHDVLYANNPALPWLNGLCTDPWRQGLDASLRGRFFQRLADFGAVDEFEVRWMGSATPSWAVLSARRLKFQGQDAVLTAFTPINKLKLMEQRLELWAKVFEASSEGIIIMDEARKIISVNRAFCRSTAYDFHEVVGADMGLLLGEQADAVWNALRDKESWQGEVHIRRVGGAVYPAWLMISAVHKNATVGEVVNYIGISIDITDRKAKEERIRFLAQHDVLTELPNRALCEQRLNQAIEQASNSGEKLAVLFIDLDRFKLINDTLGHHIGDGLLRNVARRLSQTVRADDTVCRLGGDEFVVIMRHVTGREELDFTVNQRLIPALRQTCVVEGNTLNISCSVGVALFPDDATEQSELMRLADAAMYEAKSAGRDTSRFFSQETNNRVMARQIMETQLRQALDNQEFSLHYQPRIHAKTRQMQGAEALLRWNNPVLGQVPPGQFIQLAEETGLIKGIGLWVLREACRQWMEFEQQGVFHELELSVNLSGAQLADVDLVDQIRQVLIETQMPARYLELELTESHLMDNPTAAQEKLATLKRLGVNIAIDDFGTGYSSLAYLKRFEIDKLKVDQSFVLGMMDDSADAAIVHAVIALGHTLGLAVVAEGVESWPMAQALVALGVDELQGYWFSRPLSVPDFVQWVKGQPEGTERRRAR
jgi:diguanylate cyclase (GGDEF)-like protein/PAS domain S-box-containing protein